MAAAARPIDGPFPVGCKLNKGRKEDKRDGARTTRCLYGRGRHRSAFGRPIKDDADKGFRRRRQRTTSIMRLSTDSHGQRDKGDDDEVMIRGGQSEPSHDNKKLQLGSALWYFGEQAPTSLAFDSELQLVRALPSTFTSDDSLHLELVRRLTTSWRRTTNKTSWLSCRCRRRHPMSPVLVEGKVIQSFDS
jgi:hypothetical protein